jgi:hypothetical protein
MIVMKSKGTEESSAFLVTVEVVSEVVVKTPVLAALM